MIVYMYKLKLIPALCVSNTQCTYYSFSQYIPTIEKYFTLNQNKYETFSNKFIKKTNEILS